MGSGWGFPTVNTRFEPLQLLPKRGVYATCAKVGNDLFLSVIISRLDGEKLSSLDLYGEDVRVGFLEFLREEKKFSSVEALKTEIEKNRAYTVEKYGSQFSKIVKF